MELMAGGAGEGELGAGGREQGVGRGEGRGETVGRSLNPTLITSQTNEERNNQLLLFLAQ